MTKLPVSNPKVLVVDDNRDGLLVRKLLLEEVGYQVEIAQSAEEALQMFAPGAYCVLVTDYRMPGMSGVDLIERVRKMDTAVKIILLSAFVEPLGLTEQNTGANTVIPKSSGEATVLVRSVRRLANAQQQRKPPARQNQIRAAVRGNLAN